MRLSELTKGLRARKPVVLPIGDTTVTVDVRVLGPMDDVDIAAYAVAEAKARAGDGKEADPTLIEQFERAHTIVRACIDHDSPADAPTPFFTSVSELLDSSLMTRDHIAFLYEQQYRWQDECSPRRRSLSAEEYIHVVSKAASGNLDPFFLLAPGCQASCFIGVVRSLVTSQTLPSRSSSTSEETNS